MRLRTLLASTALVMPSLMVGCTSDLPAPYNFDVLEPPPPDNELAVDCANLPVTAEGSAYDQTPTITGQLDGVSYRYSSTDLPAGLVLNENNGQISGTVEAERGDYTFDVTIEDVDDPENYFAVGTCNLQVRPRLSAPLALDARPYCLRPGQSLLDVVAEGTGDGTPISCDWSGGNGNGRKPTGIEVDAEGCGLTGAIQEDRYGTWVFAMRGVQSGASVYVPYCVTNDVAQGYDITGTHSGIADAALIPITQVYDPTADFAVGMAGDPHYEVLAPGICGASCFYKYSFLRTNAPLAASGGFGLDPDGLVQDAMTMESVGFFHELRLAGPPVPEEFLIRPWVLSVAVSYCISDSDMGCVDVAADGDGAFELGVIMVPDRG